MIAWAGVVRWAGLLGAVTLLFSGCSRPEGNRLVVYSAGPRPLAEAIIASFEQAANIRVELFSATTGQIMAKIEAEKYNPRADVVLLAAETPMLGLKQAGRLLPHRPEGLKEPRDGWADPEGYYHATGAAAVGIAFREGESDKTAGWLAVLDRGVATGSGRVVMPSPSRSGTAGDFILALHAMEPEGFWERFKSARRRGFDIVGANSQAVTGLSIGAFDAVYCAADYIICREIARGEKLEMFYPPEGCLFVYRPVAILASTRRPDAARRFVDFCFTPEAQKLIAAQHLIPASREVALSGIRARFPMPQPMAFDVAAAIREQKAIVRRFQYEVERAVVVR